MKAWLVRYRCMDCGGCDAMSVWTVEDKAPAPVPCPCCNDPMGWTCGACGGVMAPRRVERANWISALNLVLAFAAALAMTAFLFVALGGGKVGTVAGGLGGTVFGAVASWCLWQVERRSEEE